MPGLRRRRGWPEQPANRSSSLNEATCSRASLAFAFRPQKCQPKIVSPSKKYNGDLMNIRIQSAPIHLVSIYQVFVEPITHFQLNLHIISATSSIVYLFFNLYRFSTIAKFGREEWTESVNKNIQGGPIK